MENVLDILTAISEKYVSIHVFDLQNNSIEVIKTHPFIEKWSEGFTDIQGKLFNVVEQNTTAKSQEAHREFVTLSTLPERLKRSSAISVVYQGSAGGWCKAHFFRIGHSEPITKVVYTVENIDDTINRENMLLEVSGLLSDSFSSVYWIDVTDGASHNLKYDDVASRYLPDANAPTFEKLGRKYMDTMIVPEDVPGLEPYFNLKYVVDQLQTKKQLQCTYRTIRKEGIVYYRLKIVPFDDKQKFVLGFENIDKPFRKEQEARKFEAAQTVLLSGLSCEYQTVWLYDYLDHTAQLITNNGQSAQTTHTITNNTMGNYEKTVGQFIDSFVVPEEREELSRKMQLSYLMGHTEEKKLTFYNFTVRYPAEETHYFQICITKVISTDGRTQFVCGFRNIDAYMAEERQKQERLEDAVRSAEQANRAKSTFLFNMSHDIRTPLNAIKGFTELVDYTPMTADKAEDYRQKVLMATNQLTDILNNVLEMARIENDKIVIDEEIIAVEPFCENCAMVFEGELKSKGITLNRHCDIAHEYLYMDRTHLNEIFMNVMSNAIKYTPAGGSITVNTIERSGESPDTCLMETTIQDTGIGMSQEFLHNIFDEFARERNSSQSGIQGTGLGMAIVKRLVELMNGTIQITSEVGEGTTVVIRIPHRIGTAPAKPKQKPKEIQRKNFVGNRILLAEDIDVNALLAIEILKVNGFQVDRASNGVECIDMLNKADNSYYDLILMDIQMPVMDGYQATYRIRSMQDEKKANIPIVALSANAFKEDIEKSRMAGMNDHLAKPIDIGDLTTTLGKLLKCHRTEKIEDLLIHNGLNLSEIESSDTGIYCVDDTRRIVYWNKACESYTGYTSDEVIGRHCFYSGLKHEDAQGTQLCMRKCPMMATILEGKSRETRISVLCKDGERRWINVETQPLRKDDEIRGAIEYFTLAEN